MNEEKDPAYIYIPLPEGVEEIQNKPVELDDASFTPREGLIPYSKELLEEGAKYYSKMKINEPKVD